MAENTKPTPAPAPQHTHPVQSSALNTNNPLPEKGKAVTVGYSGTLKRIDS